MSEELPSTEATQIDLIALRNWHFHASMDPDRQPEMRRWHRRQSDIISLKLSRLKGEKFNLTKIVMIECLAQSYRENLHADMGILGSFDWESECVRAKAAILAKLAHRS